MFCKMDRVFLISSLWLLQAIKFFHSASQGTVYIAAKEWYLQQSAVLLCGAAQPAKFLVHNAAL